MEGIEGLVSWLAVLSLLQIRSSMTVFQGLTCWFLTIMESTVVECKCFSTKILKLSQIILHFYNKIIFTCSFMIVFSVNLHRNFGSQKTVIESTTSMTFFLKTVIEDEISIMVFQKTIINVELSMTVFFELSQFLFIYFNVYFVLQPTQLVN